MNERDGSLIQLFLKKELVLDQVLVDEVAHRCAGVPSDVVGIHIHVSQEAHHFGLVRAVDLGPRGGGISIGVAVVGRVDGEEGEAVGNFKDSVDVHSNEGTSGGAGILLGGVFDDFHQGLEDKAWSARSLFKAGK